MLHVIRHMSSVASCMSHAASWRARVEASTHARAHARTHARTSESRRSLGIAVADEAVGYNAVGLGLPRILCAAAAPHPSLHGSARLQIALIAAGGTAAEKALLADLRVKNPDASFIELLRRFNVRCRRSALVAIDASGARGILHFARAHLLAAAAPDSGPWLPPSALGLRTAPR